MDKVIYTKKDGFKVIHVEAPKKPTSKKKAVKNEPVQGSDR